MKRRLIIAGTAFIFIVPSVIAAQTACSVSYGTNSIVISGAGTCAVTIPQVNTVTVEVWGGGGGGGGGGWVGSFGGGGGGYSKQNFATASLPQTVTVTVGNGGQGGGTSAWTGGCYGYGAGSAGSPGGASSFGSYLSAGGGSGGGYSGWGFYGGNGPGGPGGTGSTETGGKGGGPGSNVQTCDDIGNCTTDYVPDPAGAVTYAGGGGGGENPNWSYANGDCITDAGHGGTSQYGGAGGISAYAKYWCQSNAGSGSAPAGGGGGGNEPVSNSCSQMYAATAGASGAAGQVKISWTQQCTTPPDSVANGNGFSLFSGILNRWLNSFGYSYCISNASGYNYFIPAHTQGELQSFLNAVPRLNGVTKSTP